MHIHVWYGPLLKSDTFSRPWWWYRTFCGHVKPDHTMTRCNGHACANAPPYHHDGACTTQMRQALHLFEGAVCVTLDRHTNAWYRWAARRLAPRVAPRRWYDTRTCRLWCRRHSNCIAWRRLSNPRTYHSTFQSLAHCVALAPPFNAPRCCRKRRFKSTVYPMYVRWCALPRVFRDENKQYTTGSL